MFCEIGAHTHTHTPMHTHLLFAGLNTSFLLSFQNFPSSPYPPWQHKVGLRFWLTTTTDTSPPLLPLHPHFNPLPIPLSLPLLFLFCSEWRSKAAVSASFPSLIALLAGGGTRSFSDTDGEGGGSSKGEKKKWLTCVCCCCFPLPPLLRLVCVDTDTSGWHWHTPDTDACQGNIRRMAGKD